MFLSSPCNGEGDHDVVEGSRVPPQGKIYANARRLRKTMTLPEVLLWRALRQRNLGGAKFRRQHPFGPYVLDFYCSEHRLAVEVDGWSHNMGPLGRDERRDAYIALEAFRH